MISWRKNVSRADFHSIQKKSAYSCLEKLYALFVLQLFLSGTAFPEQRIYKEQVFEVSFYDLYFPTRIARMELRIAMTDTPTSANTAAPMCASPNAPNARTIAFTPSAKTMFSFAMPMVFSQYAWQFPA